MTSWSLEREIDSIRAEAVRQQARVARTLLKSAEVRVVAVGIPKGATWPQHVAAGRVLVRVEIGRIELGTSSGTTQLAAGMLSALEPGETHDVHAIEDSAFLLIVAGPPGEPHV